MARKEVWGGLGQVGGSVKSSPSQSHKPGSNLGNGGGGGKKVLYVRVQTAEQRGAQGQWGEEEAEEEVEGVWGGLRAANTAVERS